MSEERTVEAIKNTTAAPRRSKTERSLGNAQLAATTATEYQFIQSSHHRRHDG